MGMNFSIILASRERVHLLDSLLNSIVQNTADQKNCEVITVIDSDDRVTRRFMERFQNTCPFARFVVRDRAPNLNDDYLNWAWRNFSTGDNIIVVNDDVVIKTPNWDRLIMADLSRYLSDKPDGVAYGWIQDGLTSRAGGMNYCCFPLITRKAADVLGFVMPPQFPGWGADIGIYRIYSAVNRICDLSSVYFEHISYHTNKRGRDHISHGVEQKSSQGANPENFDIGVSVERLMKYIGGDADYNKSGMLTGVTITNATLTDVTLVGGRIVGGKIVTGKIAGGKVQGGSIKSGIVNGDLQTGYISGAGDVNFLEG
jgi:hypothetical protein